ncbi:MAG: hypothetical protein VXX63_07955, partial [Bacteroidota bacterium]|nr:hypothetical protein [Bacteroidota bacterium]
MQRLLTFLIVFNFFQILGAQVPATISYQSVVRDPLGNLIKNQTIGVRFSIVDPNLSPSIVYQEDQRATTNTNGLISTYIGTGNVTIGNSLSSLNWNAQYNLRIEYDLMGGQNYTVTLFNSLTSVPYSLLSQKSIESDYVVNDKTFDGDSSSTNEIQSISIFGNKISLSKGGSSISIPSNLDNDSTNELQSLSIDNDTIRLSKGGFIKLPNDNTFDGDSSSKNEIQSISIFGNKISLSKGGSSISIPSNLDNDSTN